MLRRLIGVLALAMVVLASVQVVGAAGGVTWYWKDVNASGFSYPSGHVFDKFMNTTEAPQTSTSNTVTLDKGERAWWYAHEAAQCNLTFPAGGWGVTFWINATNSTDNGRKVTIRLQGINSTGYQISGTTGYKGGLYTISNATNIEKIEKTLSCDPVDMLEGDRIALEVLWYSMANGSLIVFYNSTSHNSSLISPSNSPVYPVPELSTLILFSTGLIALAGYVLLTKKRN